MKRGNHRAFELLLFITITFLFLLVLQPTPTGFAAVVDEGFGFTDPIEKPGVPDYSEKPTPQKEIPKERNIIEKPVEKNPSKEPIEKPKEEAPNEETPNEEVTEEPIQEPEEEEPPETRSGTNDQEEEIIEEQEETFETTGDVIDKEVFTAQATPTISSVSISPLLPRNTNNLTVSYSTSDTDGDTVYNITDWRLEGTSIVVLNMPFDVDSSIINDYSTYGNDGIEGGATWSSSGKIGGAFLFDGSNSEINITDDPSLIYGSNTITFWYKRSIEANPGFAWYHYSSSGDRYTIKLDEDEVIINSWDSVASGGQYSIHTINDDTDWHFVAVINKLPHTSGCNGNKVYFDNQLTSTTYEHCGSSWDPSINPIADSKIGYEFEGLIDEFLFFERVLTTNQISELYLAGVNGHSLEKIVSSETRGGENWSVMLTATDTSTEAELLSNTVQVILNNEGFNGDFNGDGMIDETDVVILQEIILNGDLNGDESIDIADVLYLIGLIESEELNTID